MKTVLKQIYYDTRAAAGLLKNEFSAKTRIPWSNRVKLLVSGFTSDKLLLYDFQANAKNDYLCDWVRQRTRFINAKYSLVLNDKLLSTAVLSGHIKVPDVYAVIIDGKVIPFGETASVDSPYGIDLVIELVESRRKVVMKPIDAAGGRGVMVLSRGRQGMCVNNENTKLDSLTRLINSLNRYMITEFVENAEYSKSLYDGATNTIRILTMVDPDIGTPFIAAAVHRIGTEATRPIDNFQGGRGGLVSKIDLATGMLGLAITLSENERTQYSHHPDSGNQIAGVRVPRWEELLQTILDVVRKMPYLIYVGWDVVINSENEFVVLEINNHSDFNLFQAHEPLLKNPRIRRFYEYYGVVGAGRYIR